MYMYNTVFTFIYLCYMYMYSTCIVMIFLMLTLGAIKAFVSKTISPFLPQVELVDMEDKIVSRILESQTLCTSYFHRTFHLKTLMLL